jgi:hypothetical protein
VGAKCASCRRSCDVYRGSKTCTGTHLHHGQVPPPSPSATRYECRPPPCSHSFTGRPHHQPDPPLRMPLPHSLLTSSPPSRSRIHVSALA